jgi:hypothetical protein
MKTGRVRSKEPIPEEARSAEETIPQAIGAPPIAEGSGFVRPQGAVSPSGPTGAGTGQGKSTLAILIGVGVIVACLVLFLVVALGSGTDDWVEATRANGTWTSTLVVLGPQVKVEEQWETDCTGDANAVVRAGSCIQKAANTYQDSVVEDYDEFAYEIYYDETWDQPYQAQGTEFVPISLGSDDWWEGNLHYTRKESLERESCQITSYAVWVNDPNDTSQELEVYLSQCEVWDHVVVQERVYDQKLWCLCDVTMLVQIGQQTEQGVGSNVLWPNPTVPAGGKTQSAFKGQVTFLGGDYSYTVTTDDLSQYQDFLSGPYYIGLKDGKPVTVSKNPKD